MVLKGKYIVYDIEKAENGEWIGRYCPEQAVCWEWEVGEKSTQ